MTAILRRAAAAATGAGALVFALPAGFLVAMLGAAAARLRRPAPSASRRTRFTVLVPAHDEEPVVAGTVRALLGQDYPEDRRRVVVVADNCTDATADCARAAGADVLERHDPELRGKGQALAWAIDRVEVGDALVLVDADCKASPNLLSAMDARLAAGADAVQADYVVANPEASRAAALRYAAFAQINTVRPAGRDAIGASCGLLGSGMALSRRALERVPWRSFGVGEDAEQHARLVEAGMRVAFAPEARVSSPMPLAIRAGAEQQLRWETTRADFVREWTPRLLRRAARERDLRALHLGLEVFVPPQSLLFGANALLAVAATVAGAPRAARLAAASLTAQLGAVLGGLVLVRAPLAVYRALAMAPLLAVWKVWVYAQLAAGRGSTDWVRTERDQDASARSTAAR